MSPLLGVEPKQQPPQSPSEPGTTPSPTAPGPLPTSAYPRSHPPAAEPSSRGAATQTKPQAPTVGSHPSLGLGPHPAELAPGRGGSDGQPRPPGPCFKPVHYSKTIIYPQSSGDARAYFWPVPISRAPIAPGRRCHCNFYQGLFLVKSLFVSERCDLAFFLFSFIPWLIYHFPEPRGQRGGRGLLKSHCFSSKSRLTLPGPALSSERRASWRPCWGVLQDPPPPALLMCCTLC